MISILLALASFASLSDVITIKSDAPTTYVVKKGDTLWDISSVFLEKAWLWPELWRKNTQIENPHLIYPGDRLRLTYIDGVPTFELARDKPRITLNPNSTTTQKAQAIQVLPWDKLAPYINNGSILTAQTYEALPRVLGDAEGTPSFVSNDFVLAHSGFVKATTYDVIRKQRMVVDSHGKPLGYQVDHLAKASPLTSNRSSQLVKIETSKQEARQGDRLKSASESIHPEVQVRAATHQRGEIVENVNGRRLIGKQDVVILNLGKRSVSEGTVLGVYAQGPAILDKDEPEYVREDISLINQLSFQNTIRQPAIKVGEVIVFKTFEHASYALVSKSATYFKGGEIVAKP